jgi:hypothetical protein
VEALSDVADAKRRHGAGHGRSAVLNTSVRRAGIVVLRSMTFVMSLPSLAPRRSYAYVQHRSHHYL